MAGPEEFPRCRAESGLGVTVRFTASGTEAAAARAAISRWTQRNDNGSNPRFGLDFLDGPRVTQDDQGICVTFERTASSRRWKDWLVSLVREVQESSDGITFTGLCYPAGEDEPQP